MFRPHAIGLGIPAAPYPRESLEVLGPVGHDGSIGEKCGNALRVPYRPCAEEIPESGVEEERILEGSDPVEGTVKVALRPHVDDLRREFNADRRRNSVQ